MWVPPPGSKQKLITFQVNKIWTYFLFKIILGNGEKIREGGEYLGEYFWHRMRWREEMANKFAEIVENWGNQKNLEVVL